MNDYEMMNQRVDQLRIYLARIHADEAQLKADKECIMTELLDTRRQITKADRWNKTLADNHKQLAPVDYLDV